MAQVKQIVLFGLIFESLIAVVCLLAVAVGLPNYFKSSLLGCLVFYIPNTYFAIYAFRYSGASLTPWIVRSFYWGQTGKLALSAVAFGLVFYFHSDIDPLALFLAFIFMILIHLASAVWVSNKLAALSD